MQNIEKPANDYTHITIYIYIEVASKHISLYVVYNRIVYRMFKIIQRKNTESLILHFILSRLASTFSGSVQEIRNFGSNFGSYFVFTK